MATLNQDIVNKFLGEEKNRDNFTYHTLYKKFCVYDNGYYKFLLEEEVEEIITKYIIASFGSKNVTGGLIKDIRKLLSIMSKKISIETFRYIAFKDCLLDTEDFSTVDFDRSKVSVFKINCYYSDVNKTPKKFMEFIQQMIVTKENPYLPDEELITLAQEMIGYFLIGNLHGATAWFLVGEGSNGKSVLADTIEAMIGEDFVSTSTIESLTMDKFNTHHLIGKRLNVSREDESKYIKPDKFKALVTGDPIQSEYKFGDKIRFKPNTKYMFCTNNIPTFKDIDLALRRRIQIIPCYRIFQPEEKNLKLDWPDSILKDEIPGIVGWALEGAKRLVRNNFVYSKARASANAMLDFESEVSSSIRFVREYYDVDDNAFISGQELYNSYKTWALDVGKKSRNKDNFLRDVMSGIKGIRKEREQVDSKREYGYNLILKNDNEETENVIKSFETSIPTTAEGDSARENSTLAI